VVILDEENRQALAVVPENLFSLAIGKQGLNVRLANRLCDWNIDVKTEEQYGDLDGLVAESRRAAQELFNDNYDEITTIQELPGVDEDVAKILKENNIVDIEDFIAASEDGRLEDIEGISKEDVEKISALIESSVEFVEEEVQEDDVEVEETTEEIEEEFYECPECGAKITTDMTTCPNCGIGLSFEYEEEEEE
jgi:N utilization substance protein A